MNYDNYIIIIHVIIYLGVIMNYVEKKAKLLNFNKLTPIQEKTLENINSDKNIIGLANTGTGKTHAYLFSCLKDLEKSNKVEVVIIVPTNELVMQVQKMLNEFNDEFIVKAYHGSINNKREEEYLLKSSPNIVISTPSKLHQYVIEKNLLKIHEAKYVIFDEADMMFDDKFFEFIDPLMSAFQNSKLLLFSATIKPHMKKFIDTYFGNSILLDTRLDEELNIKHYLIHLKQKSRDAGLIELLKHINPFTLFIFVSNKNNIEHVYNLLIEEGYNAVSISSNLSVRKRKNIIDDIRDDKIQYVVTSDLFSRGMDFTVTHVINYDLPNNTEYYMHRAGRTGRMGSEGLVYTLYEDRDSRKLERLRRLNINFINLQVSRTGIKEQIKMKKEDELFFHKLKKIRKPKKVKPNYRKKNKAKIDKLRKELREKNYVKNR